MDIDRRPFGTRADGRPVERFDFSAGSVAVTVLDHGATLASIMVPDANGDVADITLGFDTIDGWTSDRQFFGSTVGRYANRIANARFPLGEQVIELVPNDGPHQLHGGPGGFDTRAWDAEPFDTTERVGVTFRRVSLDGDQGYPGTVEVSVTYALDRVGGLSIGFAAATDAPTVINLANHVYLDLTGGNGALDHILTLDASHVLEIGEGTIPTGNVLPVANSPFDFTTPTRIGDRLEDPDPQLAMAGGYDHCWVIDGQPGTLRRCAVVAAGGRTLTMETTQPGVQFYSGNAIHGSIGRGGVTYGPRAGFCLETQHFPDSPNHSSFPSTRLDPGDTYHQTTIMRFGTV